MGTSLLKYSAKKYARNLSSDRMIDAFTREMLGNKNWHSSHRHLKWNAIVAYSAKTISERVHFVGEKSLGRTKKNEKYEFSKYLVYKLMPFTSKESDTLEVGGLFDTDDFEGIDLENSLLPTPTASDGQRGGQKVDGKKKERSSGQTYSSNIVDLAVSELLPTPTAMSAKGNVTQDRGYYNLTDIIAVRYKIEPMEGGTSLLNPLYVEEMMGFPEGWILLPFLKNKAKGNVNDNSVVK